MCIRDRSHIDEVAEANGLPVLAKIPIDPKKMCIRDRQIIAGAGQLSVNIDPFSQQSSNDHGQNGDDDAFPLKGAAEMCIRDSRISGNCMMPLTAV